MFNFWMLYFMFILIFVLCVYKMYNNFISLMIVLESFSMFLLFLICLNLNLEFNVLFMIMIAVMVMEVALGVSLFIFMKNSKKNMFFSNLVI